MLKNIHAYTEPGADYPAYVSINRDNLGKHTISVRSRGQARCGEIELTPEQLEQLATDVLDHLHRDDAEAGGVGESFDPALPATVVLLQEVARWRDAYNNMRDFAEQNGLDTTCYGPHAGPAVLAPNERK